MKETFSAKSSSKLGCWFAQLAFSLLFLVCLGAPWVSNAEVLDSETWSRPRSGSEVAQMPAVKSIVQRWMNAPQMLIQIRYPGGEENSLWAFELRDWLVALGIESSSISLQGGRSQAGELILELRELPSD